MNSFTESSGLLKRSKEYVIEKSLRAAHRILLKKGDSVSGAPVTELKYTHYIVMPYLKRLIWRHISEFGVVPRVYTISSLRLTIVLGVGFFLLMDKKCSSRATCGTPNQTV